MQKALRSSDWTFLFLCKDSLRVTLISSQSGQGTSLAYLFQVPETRLPCPLCYLWSGGNLTKTSGTTESKTCCQNVEGVVISSRAADSSIPTHLHGEMLLELCYQVSQRLLHHVTWESLCQHPVPNNQ